MNRLLRLTLAMLGLATGVYSAAAQVTVTTAPPATEPAATAPATTSAPAPATRRAANDATPTLLTLHYQDAPADVVLADIAAQIGRTVRTTLKPPYPRVSVEAQKQPFWLVVTRICDALNLNVSWQADGPLSFQPRPNIMSLITGPQEHDTMAGPHCVSGAFLVTAGAVHREAAFAANPADQDQCMIDISLFAEPHVRLMTLVAQNRPRVAVDELGQSLVPAPERVRGVPVTVTEWLSLNMLAAIRLSPPEGVGRRIAEVQGELVATVLGKSETLTYTKDDWTERIEEPFHGMTVRVEKLRKLGENEWLPQITFLKGRQTDAEWERTNRLLDALEMDLLDAQGQRLYSGGLGGGRGGDERVFYGQYKAQVGAFNRQPTGEPAQLVVRVPLELQEIRIPYEFKNLPLR